VRIGGLVLDGARGGVRPGRVAIALVVFLVMLVAVVAPAAFLTGLILAVLGHWLAGILLILASFVIGVGGTLAIVATGVTALRRVGQRSVFRLSRGDYAVGDDTYRDDTDR
jgi:hypothetical protein